MRTKLASMWGVALVICVFILAGCGSSGPSWETLNTSQDDTIVALAQDPSQTKLLYAAADHGVVYRSRTDVAGSPISGAGLPSSAQTNALLPDLHTPGVVYAATTFGFYVTTDYGDHWRVRGIGLPANDSLTALAFGTHGTLLVGTLQHGVYASSDQGRTWHPVANGLPSGADVNTLFHDPASQSVFAGLDSGGIYASSDDGQTWIPQSSGLAPNVHVYVFAGTPSKGLNPAGPSLYAGTSAGLYAYSSGQKWAQHGIGQGLPPGGVQALAADKTPGELYAGVGSSVYDTTDGGAHWTLLAPGLSHSVAFLLVATPPDGKPALFAGAGQLQRFPALSGTTNMLLGNIISWGIILLLLGLGFYVIRRGRMRLEANLRNVHRRSEPRDGLPPI